jgi:hypothetical protein
MRRRRLLITLLLVAVFLAVLIYGIHQGDAGMVLANAKAFCFT